MSLNYTTLTSLINQKYLTFLWNNIFRERSYLWARLKADSEDFNDRQILEPLEYAKATTIKATPRYGLIELTPEEVTTGAVYTPKMLTASIMIALEDELDSTSVMAIKKILDVKMSNLQKSIEDNRSALLWTRNAAADALNDSNDFNTLDFLVNDHVTTAVGGIPLAGNQYDWWKSNIIRPQTDGYYAGGGDSHTLADLEDPAKKVYIVKLLQHGIAKARYQTGEDPTVIIVPQYLWDLLERMFDQQKLGSKLEEKIGNIGFTVLKYRNIPIVTDTYMVAAQTGDTDGRMYFLNTRYIKMRFNSGAKFKAQAFIAAPDSNTRSSLLNAYGNLTITNRQAQASIEEVYSPKAYAA